MMIEAGAEFFPKPDGLVFLLLFPAFPFPAPLSGIS
jgi:hypothetical protein